MMAAALAACCALAACTGDGGAKAGTSGIALVARDTAAAPAGPAPPKPATGLIFDAETFGRRIEVDRAPAEEVRIGAMRIELERQAFDSLPGALRPVRIAKTGDAASSYDRACYRTAAGDLYLVLGSGEMGGGEWIDGASVSRTADWAAGADLRCATLPPSIARVTLGRRLRVGMTRAQLAAELGRRAPDPGDSLAYVFDAEHTLADRSHADVTAFLDVLLRRDTVVALHAFKFTTN
jgi:hypothetical protein